MITRTSLRLGSFLSLIILMTSSFSPLVGAASGAQPDEKTSTQCAFWNQEDYDKAVHTIKQVRRVRTTFLKFIDGEPSSLRRVGLSYREEGKTRNLQLKHDGSVARNLTYTNSLLRFVVTPKYYAGLTDHGFDSVEFMWKRPGEWIDAIKGVIDLEPFVLAANSSLDPTVVTYAFTYAPTYTPRNVMISFGNLVGQEYNAGNEWKNDLGSVTLSPTGTGVITVRMKDFFAKWNESYSTPYKAGDLYTISLSMTFDAPKNLIAQAASAKQDPKFVAKKYACQADHLEGNPFLEVPDVTPDTYVRFERSLEVPVSVGMIP